MTTPAAFASAVIAPAGPRSLVAIVGRPNVGKSSLFNRLAGRRMVIVSDVPGTTRDHVSTEVEHAGRTFLLVDTGGLVPDPETALEAQVVWQVDAAVAEADVVVLLTDVVQGITPGDQEAADRLRRSKRPVVLACNKVDHASQEALVPEWYQLGLGDPIPISAYHGRGVEELLDAVLALLPPGEASPEATVSVPRLAIVGRPNVGKSALANAILGRQRSIVNEVPGTTRDALDTPLDFRGRPAVLIDTAGIRRRGSIAPGVERYSVLRAVRAIDRCDVALLVLDATELVTGQDLHIAGLVMESFKGTVVTVNKWDLVPEERRDERRVQGSVLSRLRFMDYVPVEFTSAIQGQGVGALMRAAFRVYDDRNRWVTQERLEAVLAQAMTRHPPPRRGTRTVTIYRARQTRVNPPTFVFRCNDPSLVHFSYERHLENVIRKAFGFQGTHLRLEFRGGGKTHVIGGHRAGAKRR